MKNIIAIPLLACTAFLLSTCKQTDVNPCAGAKEPTAAFTMFEADTFMTYDTDTSLWGGIRFTAMEPFAQYEWKVGTDNTIYRLQSFTLNFYNYCSQNQPNVPPVTITLKVTKTPGACFPISDSVHYMSRTLHFAQYPIVNGTFRGKFSNSDTVKEFTVNWDTTIYDPHTHYPSQGPLLVGLPNQDSLLIQGWAGYLYSYREVYIDFTNQFTTSGIRKAKMMVTPDNKTIFLWVSQSNPKLPSTYTFTGTRIK